jgi:N-formylglutamate amidohydrolase
MPVGPYKIVIRDAQRAPVIAHVPHAATFIPEAAHRAFVIDAAALDRELVRVTDWHADHLFSWVLDEGGLLFVNTVSRLAFDPERFVDDAEEPMSAVGQGAVYTRTTDGEPLADISPALRATRIEELYEPYHEGLTGAVGSLLGRFGMAIILDCHSFPTEPLPSEQDQNPHRPDICIGTDAVHTPPELAEDLEQRFRAEGVTVARNRPFAGTIVPLEYLGRDRRVISVMIEVRRGLYCDEATGERNERFDAVRSMLERAVAPAVGAAIRARRG